MAALLMPSPPISARKSQNSLKPSLLSCGRHYCIFAECKQCCSHFDGAASTKIIMADSHPAIDVAN